MLSALVPAASPLAFMLLALAIFAIRVRVVGYPDTAGASRGTTMIATPFLTRYILWLLGPIEAALAALRATPQFVTVISLALCAGAGASIALGAWILGGWLYVAAGLADVLDGRLARRIGTDGPRGALLDSVADRWGELVVGGACILGLGAPWATGAAVLALATSQMVSYTRARGEGLGVTLSGGTMQRAERMILTSLGLLIGGVLGAWRPAVGESVLGGALLAIAVASGVTAWARLRDGLRLLEVRAVEVPTIEEARAERERRRTGTEDR